MPPKKNPKISEGAPQTKRVRGRPRKIQSPISIKIKIPVRDNIDVSNKRTRKSRLPLDTQIELTNEVIRTQLERKVQITHNPDITENKPIVTPLDYTVVQSNVKEKMVTRRVTRKKANANTETIEKPATPCKRAADSTQQPAKRRKVTVKDTPVQPKPTAKRQANAKNVQNKRTYRGKKKVHDLVCVVDNCLPTESPADEQKVEPTAATIDSRKTSMTSASSFSWTKDISSSSTTTCVTVTSNDFVRIDKKIPVLQLTSVDNLVDKYKRSDKDVTTSSSGSSTSSESETMDILDLHSGSLNLSTSSPCTFTTQNQAPKTDSLKNNLAKALVKLSSMLQNFDTEIMNWIGYNDEVDANIKKSNNKILKVLKEESEIIAHCRKLRDVLSDKSPDEVDNCDITIAQNNTLEDDLNVSFDDDTPIRNNVLLNENLENLDSPRTPRSGYDCDGSSDDLNPTFERCNDDDDALSLFAESITGIEPSRTNNSVDSPPRAEIDFDEYVPESLNKNAPCTSDKYQYRPTAISKPNETVKKNVCEKQNADSTSIYKDVGTVDNMYQREVEAIANELPVESDNNVEEGEIPNTEEIPNQIGPPPVTSIFQNLPHRRNTTTLFKNMCFHNLHNDCKKPRCPFVHIVPSAEDIKMCLRSLTEQKFIDEYKYLSSWTTLRRKYGIYFVEEAHRRGLPRVLVEMAIDYVLSVKSRQDYECQVHVLEQILLSLNDVGLAVCEDLLLNYTLYNGERLCDVFMSVIANSPNFSRFKQVFMNLTNVMVRHQRTFSFAIASQILERVSILPAEERLVHAVFDIIKNTDSSIFGSSMISEFETRLMSINTEWHEEFIRLRDENFMSSNQDQSQSKGKELEPLNVNCANNVEKERYTSPDTTNLDTLQNNTPSELTKAWKVKYINTRNFQLPPQNNVEDWLNNKYDYRRRSGMLPPVRLLSMPCTRPMFPPHRLIRYRPPQPRFRPTRPPRNF